MAFKINYDGTNNIFLVTALTIPSRKEGIAVDALRVIFQHLFEAGDRLESKILKLSTNPSEIDASRSDFYVSYSSILGDTWAIIDGIRRLELVIKHIPDLPQIITEKLNSVFEKIKYVRDSFQHIDERIDLHFDRIGGSVFGEITWRYRENFNLSEILNCIVSGVSRRARHTDMGTGPENPEFSQNLGVYDLNLIYIKRDSRKGETHSKVLISIDEAVKNVDSLIVFLEDKYSRYYQSLDLKEKVKGSKPGWMQLRIKQEVFDRKNKQ